MAAARTSKVYQVFIGCPFRKPIRKNYDKLKRDFEKETPFRVVLTDTEAISSSDYLLESITDLISESAGCIFDVTGGNPNVSLEVGIAHALPADFLLTFYTRKPRTSSEREAEREVRSEGEVKPIIADLQGRNRIEYKTYNALKEQVVNRYLNRLPYMRRWRDFARHKRSYVEPALELFEELRRSGRSRRARIDAILEGTGIPTSDLVAALSDHKLLVGKRGRMGGYFYPAR